jgi:hypothetical protein
MNKYIIKNFNLEKISSGIIFIVGMRASGKTHIIKDILIQKRHFRIGRIFCPIRSDYNMYSDFISKDLLYHRYNKYLALEVIENQKLDNSNTAIIVFDDVLSSIGDWVNDPILVELVTKAKELNILVVFAFQYLVNLPSSYIDNVDYAFLLPEAFPTNQERLYKILGNNFDNFEQFRKVFERINDISHFTSMVIDKKNQSTNLIDNIYKYTSICNHYEELKNDYDVDLKYILDTEDSDSSDEQKEIILDLSMNMQNNKDSSTETSSVSSSDTFESEPNKIKEILERIHNKKNNISSEKSKKNKIKILLNENKIYISKNNNEIEISLE